MAPIHRARVRKQHMQPAAPPTLLVRVLLRPDQIYAMRRFNQVAMGITLFCFVHVLTHLVAAHPTPDDELDAMLCCTCYSFGAYLLQAVCTWLQCDEFKTATKAAAVADGKVDPGAAKEKEHALLPVARYRAATLFVFAMWCIGIAAVIMHDHTPSIPEAVYAMQRATTINCVYAILQLLLVRGQAIYWKCNPATLAVQHHALPSTPGPR